MSEDKKVKLKKLLKKLRIARKTCRSSNIAADELDIKYKESKADFIALKAERKMAKQRSKKHCKKYQKAKKRIAKLKKAS